MTYAEFIEGSPSSLPKDVKTNLNKNEIYNVFILPGILDSDSEKLKYFGFSYADFKNETSKSYSKIYGFLFDVKSVMYCHIPKNKELIFSLANKISEQITEKNF